MKFASFLMKLENGRRRPGRSACAIDVSIGHMSSSLRGMGRIKEMESFVCSRRSSQKGRRYAFVPCTDCADSVVAIIDTRLDGCGEEGGVVEFVFSLLSLRMNCMRVGPAKRVAYSLLLGAGEYYPHLVLPAHASARKWKGC